MRKTAIFIAPALSVLYWRKELLRALPANHEINPRLSTGNTHMSESLYSRLTKKSHVQKILNLLIITSHVRYRSQRRHKPSPTPERPIRVIHYTGCSAEAKYGTTPLRHSRSIM